MPLAGRDRYPSRYRRCRSNWWRIRCAPIRPTSSKPPVTRVASGLNSSPRRARSLRPLPGRRPYRWLLRSGGSHRIFAATEVRRGPAHEFRPGFRMGDVNQIAPESVTRSLPAAHSTSAAGVESRAIWVAIGFAAVAVIIGFIAFSNKLTPLSADYSVGTVAGWTAGIAAGASALIGLIVATESPRGKLGWMRRRFWGWWLSDFIGLIITHGAIATLAVLSTFRLFQEAFQGLVVDAIAATVMLCLVTAAASYFGFSSASRATTSSISTLLALFMAAGVLASMLLAENPYWWHMFFSDLGTGQAGVLSFWTFNTTIAVSGIVLTTLANFITQDLDTWAEHRRQRGKRRRGVGRILKVGMILMGICLIGLSLVSIHVSDPIHTGFVQILAGTFGLILLSEIGRAACR